MFLKKFRFGKRYIGERSRTFFIAEIGINHEGSFNKCKFLIDKAKKAGADAVKLQTIDPEENYIKNTPSYKIFKKSFLEKKDVIKLFNYSKLKNIDLFTTIGDLKTLDWISKLKPPGYKISSGLFSHKILIEEILKLSKPVIFSTGMASEEEVDSIYKLLKKKKAKKIAFLHCCSLYPSSNNNINLATIRLFQKKYSIPIGYSDHSIDYRNILYAISSGASIIEKHFTFDKKKKGFDHKISCDYIELIKIIKNIRILESTIGTLEKRISNKEKNKRKVMRRYIVAKKDLLKECVITINDIAFKRVKNPFQAFDAQFVYKLLGKKLNRNLNKDQILKLKHLK